MQQNAALAGFNTFLGKVEKSILNPIIELLILAAFIVFIWGVIDTFILNGGNEEKRQTGQQHMLWGFVGLVIMFGVKAIIAILASTIGVPVPTTP